MALDTPTINEISTTIVNQIEAEINQTIPLLPKAFTRVLAKVLGAVFIILYKYGGFIFLQMFVSRATWDSTTINGIVVQPLIAWGRLIGEGDPIPSANAELDVQLKFTSDLGSTLIAGTQLIRTETGVVYETTSAETKTADVFTVIRAISDQSGGDGAGAIGNLGIGDELSYVTAPTGAQGGYFPTITGTETLGTDAETQEEYRLRVVNRWQRRPQGGAHADYYDWVLDTPGLINAYPYAGDPGIVNVFAEATPASSGDPDGIPTLAQLQSGYAFIQLNELGLATRRPVSAFIGQSSSEAIFPITRNAWDVNVQNMISDDVTQTRSDVEDALAEFFLTYEPYIVGLTTVAMNNITKSDVNGEVRNVVRAAGGTLQDVDINPTGGAVTESYFLGIGEKAKLGNVIWS